jgi:adhesin transport system outer membrane protein
MKAFKSKIYMGLLCTGILIPTAINAQSLEQAVAYTLDTHPDIRAAYTYFKVSEKKVDQAKSDYLPTLDLTGGIGYEYTDSPSTRSNGESEDLVRRELGISLKQNLFRGFHTQSEVGRTSSAASAEQWRLYASAEDLALKVSQVYVDYIKAEELVALSEKNLASHQKIYDQIKVRTDSGFGSKADLSQIEGRLANAESNVIAAKNNFLDSQVAFYRVISQSPDDLVIPYPDSSLLPNNKDDGLKLAFENHPVIRAAASDINSADYQYKAAKSNNYPHVSLEIDANRDDNLDGTEGEYNEVVAMVRFSYNLFSGGKDKSYTKETAYKMNEAKELNRSAFRQVEEEYQLSWNAYELLNMQKEFIKTHVVSAKNTQSDYQEQFQVGRRTLLDLLDTENELYQARRDFLAAEFDEISAQYRIFHAMGILIDALRVTRPDAWKGEAQYKGGVSQ